MDIPQECAFWSSWRTSSQINTSFKCILQQLVTVAPGHHEKDKKKLLTGKFINSYSKVTLAVTWHLNYRRGHPLWNCHYHSSLKPFHPCCIVCLNYTIVYKTVQRSEVGTWLGDMNGWRSLICTDELAWKHRPLSSGLSTNSMVSFTTGSRDDGELSSSSRMIWFSVGGA